jgi:asparagine synthase (glutamine-hydrolysing)
MSEPQREGASVVPSASVALGPRREWSAVGGARATGFAFRGVDLLRAEQLAAAIDTTAPDALPSLLDDLTGSFAAIKETPDAAYAIVDQIRGMPLYCVEERGRRVVTDDPLSAVPTVRAGGSDWRVRAEFLKCACVSAADTLLDGVHQVEAGSLLRVPTDSTQPTTNHQWYAFRSGLDPDTSTDLLEAGHATHKAAVDRMIRFADDALIVVPLSAGLDSGIIAALLAASDVDREQILTFTFGQPGNRESEVSRGVAESLGLRWEFVPYGEHTWQELVGRPTWPGYLAWASSLAGAPGFADIPALFELRDRGLVPDGSVVVPGHTLGFISGSFIPGSLLHRRRGSRARVIDALMPTYYKYRSDHVIGQLLDRSATDVAEAVRERADLAVPASPASMPREQLVSLVDEWGWKERQAKIIVNGVRAYEDQDLRWALPWWDREVMDFWARVPLQLRVGQRLRRELAELVGWPTASRSALDSLQERVDRQVRMLALDGPAKKARNLARRATRRGRYDNDELACLALIGKERFLRTYTGTQTPRAFLAEDVLSALDA